MTFRKATVLVGLFVVCFVLAAQSAKADDIIFNDLGDTILVTGTVRFAPLSASCTVSRVWELCSVTITPPTGGSFGSTSLPNQLNILGVSLSGLGISEGNSTLSDALVISNNDIGSRLLPPGTVVNFLSDPPAASGVEASLGICNQKFLGISIPCDITETGEKQHAGTINWVDSGGTLIAQDNVYFLSEVPEPASLILFGSGLALASGFLRRRWGLVTPSV